MNRHWGLKWSKVQARLEANGERLWALNETEKISIYRKLLIRTTSLV